MVSANTVHTDCGHEVELAGAWPLANGAPSLVVRTDEDFLPALLGELATTAAPSVVPTHRPTTGPDGVTRLFQPVHRAFNIALLEAHCTGFGIPRLDARQIESSGLVVRRVRTVNGTKHHD